MNAPLSYYLAVAFFYFVDIIQKVTSSQKITWDYIFVRSIFTTAITFLITILWKGMHSIPDPKIIAELMMDSAICTLGLFFYIKSINSLKFSNVGSLSIIGIVIQQIYFYLFGHNPIRAIDILACFLMSFGSIIQISNLKFQKGAFYVFCSSFFWTVGYISLSKTLQKTDYFWSVPFMELTVLTLSGIVILLVGNRGEKSMRTYKNNIGPFIILGLLIYISSLCNNYSFKHNSLSTISFLQLSIMPITFILSLKIFKEKPKMVELISFVFSVIGFTLFVFKQYIPF